MNILKIKLLLVTAGMLLFNFSAFAQEVKELTVGDKVPEMVFNEVVNDKASSIRLSDFRGKVVIIDFWATWCAPCVAEMPKLNLLLNKYKKDIMVLPISHEKKTDVLKFKEKRPDLDLPFILEPNESKVRKYFPYRILPHQVIIDQTGVIAAIIDGRTLNEALLNKLINREKISLPIKKDQLDFNPEKPLFMDGNGGNGEKAFLTSIVAPYLDGVSSSGHFRQDSLGNYYGMDLINNSIVSMYEHAFGFPLHYRNRMLVEGSTDSLRYQTIYPFQHSKVIRDAKFRENNWFCYSLRAPYLANKNFKIAQEVFREILKNELNRVFGKLYGLNVHVEPRRLNCYLIRKKADFDSKIKQVSFDTGKDNTQPNKTLSIKIADLEAYLVKYLKWKPIVDQTGVGSTVIPFDADKLNTNNLLSINEYLGKYGLEIFEEESSIEMLVFKVTDKK